MVVALGNEVQHALISASAIVHSSSCRSLGVCLPGPSNVHPFRDRLPDEWIWFHPRTFKSSSIFLVKFGRFSPRLVKCSSIMTMLWSWLSKSCWPSHLFSGYNDFCHLKYSNIIVISSSSSSSSWCRAIYVLLRTDTNILQTYLYTHVFGCVGCVVYPRQCDTCPCFHLPSSFCVF